MFHKRWIGLAATAVLALALTVSADTAQAKQRHYHTRHNHGIGLFLGLPFFFDDYIYDDGYPYEGRYNDRYSDGNCVWVKTRKKHKKIWVKRCYTDG